MAETEEIGLHNLKPNPGSRHRKKRVGRGEGSGFGKTSGRGQKGAGSRAGSKKKVGHEGGQNPIHMRMRKLRGADVTPDSLREKNLATRKDIPVKVLGRGEISKKLTVHAHGFSAAAREKIE